MLIPFELIVLAATAFAPTVDASKLTLSAPAAIVELDTGKLKGDPVRLSWSTDEQQMYLQTVERDRGGNVKSTHHYLLGLDGTPPKGVDEEPAWSTRYWAWKSGQSAPGLMSFKIDVDQQRQRRSATAAPMGGDLAKGGVDGRRRRRRRDEPRRRHVGRGAVADRQRVHAETEGPGHRRVREYAGHSGADVRVGANRYRTDRVREFRGPAFRDGRSGPQAVDCIEGRTASGLDGQRLAAGISRKDR